ncbi:hypothetical protein RRG08_005580 [Elysia crispata]|uniref:Sodium-coupled monocarboxylate transporter 1 n=1 Tax=Elysia crispata TaxID=231223 RepID=A0AAE1ECX3_9GAST|nr:hypothetical protein RRG08_005580 [Elysia crispata]
MSPIAGASFQWQDYLMFSLMLVVSSLIGVFFALKNLRMKNTSSDEMLTGSRRLSALPVALSLVASFASASSLLGIPVQVYTQGGNQWLWAFGMIPCFLTVTFFIMPIFYRLRLTNAYEYLELRFNKTIRTMGSAAFTLIILIYMAAALYGPAVALSQVTGLSREISMLAIGLVCTFYTSIGGIRAVVWTDAFQIILVFVCSLIILSKGAIDVGGWDQVWHLAANGSRLPYFDMDPDPFLPHTFWTFAIGGGLNLMTVYGGNQANLQRYGSVKTLAQARGALLACMVMWIVYISLQCLLGLVMYASFLTCDPLTSGMVSRKDQLVPLFVMETMGAWPGLPGFFVASIFSASISTVSSGINSLAAVTLEDVVKPIYKWTKADLSKKSSYRITVALSRNT